MVTGVLADDDNFDVVEGRPVERAEYLVGGREDCLASATLLGDVVDDALEVGLAELAG